MIAIGGSKPQMRRAPANAWSGAKGREFLSVLAETLNVSEACRVSGLSSVVAYRRRKSDAAFRAGWLDAIGEAYRRLELVLLDRAFNGVEKVIRRRDGSEERMRQYSDELGFKLLKMHRDSAVESEAEAEMQPEELEEIRERLVRKLQRLKKRDDQEEALEQQSRSQQLRDGERDGGHEECIARAPAQGDRHADG